jgi:hypothetical protein
MIAIVNSQIEYWKREFDASVIIKDVNFQSQVLELIKIGLKPVIQIDKDIDEINFLSMLPKKSIIAWMHSDEALDISFNKKVINLESIALIIRPYHLNNPKLKNLRQSASYISGNIKQINSIIEFIKLISWFCRGLGMYFREQRIIRMIIKKQKSFHNFPLGYTDVFCKSYLKISEFEPMTSDQSLLHSQFIPKISATNKINFVGQIGQIVRTVAIRSAESAPESIVIRRIEYGAGSYKNESVQANGMEYARMMLQSQFVLCPPGNISGNSFRIHETVISRRVPIVIANPLSDPNFISPVKEIYVGKKSRSWDQIIKSLPLLSADRYKSLVEANLELFQNQILISKALIEKVTNEVIN